MGKTKNGARYAKELAHPSGADSFRSRDRIYNQIGSNFVDFAEGWVGNPPFLEGRASRI